MSSLLDVMSGGNSLKKIHVSEIRNNPLNFYAHMNAEDEAVYVENAAKQLIEHGQQENAVVYFDDTVDDGKKYTLTSGERRWKATIKNFEDGNGDGMLFVKIEPKPEDEFDEMLKIIMGNAIRNKDTNTKRLEVKNLERIWEHLPPDERRGRKREWISSYCGMCPREVQEYLTGNLSEVQEENSVPSTGQTADEQMMSSSEMELIAVISKNMKSELETRKVSVSTDKKKINVYLSVKTTDISDVNTVLEIFGVSESINGLCAVVRTNPKRKLSFTMNEKEAGFKIMSPNLDDMLRLIGVFGFDNEGHYVG